MKNKKLQLNKETIAKLNDDSMSMVRGGGLAKGIPKAGFWTFDGKCTDGCGWLRRPCYDLELHKNKLFR